MPSIKFSKRHHQQLLPGLNFTDEQLFFIGFAQTWCAKITPETMIRSNFAEDKHASPEHRVIGSLSNMPEFSKAFKCPKGSMMNPNQRCRLWFDA